MEKGGSEDRKQKKEGQSQSDTGERWVKEERRQSHVVGGEREREK